MRSLFCLLLLAPPALAADSPLRRIGPARDTGSSLAVVVEDVPVVQTTQVVPKSGLAPADQVEAVLDQLADMLRHARTGPEKAVRLHFYAARDDVVPAIHQALAKRFTGENKPAVSIVVGAAVREGVAVSLDAVAVAGIRGVEGTVSKVLPPGWKPDREAPLAV